MKRVLCYGDSNTYGYDGRRFPAFGEHSRFDEETRWTCLLQKRLGHGWCVYEAGMGGRTTIFDDPLEYGRNGLAALDILFKSNEPLDLVILMLGTNDLKDQFSASAQVIAGGMERCILRLRELIAGSQNAMAKILVVSPANVRKTEAGGYFYDFSEASVQKGAQLPALYAAMAQKYGCLFADAAQWVQADASDGTHLNPEGHRIFAEQIASIIQNIDLDADPTSSKK